jgi:septal ring factor EnvC (AmiA/AmiB activator)
MTRKARYSVAAQKMIDFHRKEAQSEATLHDKTLMRLHETEATLDAVRRASEAFRTAANDKNQRLRDELAEEQRVHDAARKEESALRLDLRLVRSRLHDTEAALKATEATFEGMKANHKDVVDSLNKTISEMVNEFAARDQRERAYRLVLSDMIFTALDGQRK